MKVGGNTATESLLHRIGKLAFLSLWSFPNPHRKQTAGERHREGKELCDFLVVFGDHVIIFSDKQCRFRSTGDIEVDWKRWHKRAIQGSIKQILGAERWIRTRPDSVFQDAALTTPIGLPNASNMKVHRIAIAHGISNDFGTGPSQVFDPNLSLSLGFDHFENQGVPFPFLLSDVRTQAGYIHVIEGYVIERLLRVLDTTPDFLNYLSSKEALLRRVGHVQLGSELDLVAQHLKHLSDDGRHGLGHLQSFDWIYIEDGCWNEFAQSRSFQRRLLADKPSYAWDDLIDILAETTSQTTGANKVVDDNEKENILRFMASENRLNRRMLGELFSELLQVNLVDGQRFSRVIYPTAPGRPYYVLLAINRPRYIPWDQYVTVRMNLLEGYMLALRLKEQTALDIVGIGVNIGGLGPFSCDAMYYDGRRYHKSQGAEIANFSDEWGILKTAKRKTAHVQEYPDEVDPSTMKGRHRNLPCICGSGRKYKDCCLRKNSRESSI